MGNLWQFFGLPDPEIATPTVVKKPVQEKVQNPLIQDKLIKDETQLIPTDKPVTKPQKESVTPPKITVRANEPKGWRGPTTPDGDAFHDMSMLKSTQKMNYLPKALRYVCPDQMHRLPLDSIGKRISEGDTIIVDIRPLIHMDAHKDACRRQLRRLGDDLSIAIFALDDQDQLLLLPGRDVVVDISKHELGLAPMLL
jgi:hypothetical protein